MSARHQLLGLTLLCGALGCGLPAPTQSPAPRVLSIAPAEHELLPPTATVEIRFDTPMQLLDDSLWVLPFEQGARCSVDLACERGSCYHGRCQATGVVPSLVADIARRPPPASLLRQAWPIELALADGGTLLRVRPLEPWPAERQLDLVIGGGLSAKATGIPLVDGERWYTLQSGPEVGSRPIMRLVSPSDRQTDLPVNLARIVVGFSAPVVIDGGEIALVGERGERVVLEAGAGVQPCLQPDCRFFRLPHALAPFSEWRLEVRGVRDAAGRDLFVGVTPKIATGGTADVALPAGLSAPRVAFADGCLMVDLDADEPSDLRLRVRASRDPDGAKVLWSVGVTRHRLALELAPGAIEGIGIELLDLAGNRIEWQIAAPASERPPAVVITEVLANPAGPEPAQEWVELKNISSRPVQLEGWTLDDRDDGVGANVFPHAELSPGQYAVVVGRGFQSGLGADPPVAAGTLLIEVEGTVGAAGLSNAGESLVLRDDRGRLVSRYGADLQRLAPADGQSVERIDPRSCDVVGSWRLNPAGKSSPGQ